MSKVIEYFFKSYFHQNWRDDYKTSIEAVEDFHNSEPVESVNQLTQDFIELLGNGSLPQETINKLGGSFQPQSEGMSVTDWIERALSALR